MIFTSDNGGVLANGANNGPWRSEKQHVYEGGLRVPCAARWPGRVKAGSRSDRMALSMDIFATVLEAAGRPIPAGVDGVSFLPTLRGEAQPEEPRDLYFRKARGRPDVRRQDDRGAAPGRLEDPAGQDPFAPQELYNLKGRSQGSRTTWLPSAGRSSTRWPPTCAVTSSTAAPSPGQAPEK